MGWKASSIIISPKTDINFEETLNKLGFTNLTKIEDEPYEIAAYPDKDKIYIGTYKNSLILSVEDIPIQFLSEGLTDFENKLIGLFPNTEICAISLHSAVNHWGFAVIKNGQKIRAKAGDADSGTIIDFGEPLEEEKELLSSSTINDSGERTYVFDDDDDEMTEDQVGENFVFEMFKRYTGESLDSDDDLLFESSFSGYQTSKPLRKSPIQHTKPNNDIPMQKPWWKFW